MMLRRRFEGLQVLTNVPWIYLLIGSRWAACVLKISCVCSLASWTWKVVALVGAVPRL